MTFGKTDEAANKRQEKHTDYGKTVPENFNTTVKAVTGNDQEHFNGAIDAATLGLAQFQTMMAQTSFAGGMGQVVASDSDT